MKRGSSSLSYKVVVPIDYKVESKSFNDIKEKKSIGELRNSLSSKLWKPLNSFPLQPKIHTICWNFDDSKIAAGVGINQINIWDLKSNELIKEIFEVNQGISWHHKEDKLIYYSEKGFINVLDLKSDNVNAKSIPFKKNQGEDFAVDWHPKKELFAHIGSGNKISICDFNNTINQFFQEEKCLDVKFNFKGNKLASKGQKSIRVWDYEKEIQIFSYEVSSDDIKGEVTCFSWSKDENTIYFLSSQMIRIFDVEQDVEITHFSSFFSEFISFDCNPYSEKLVAVGEKDKSINIWDISDSVEIFEYSCPEKVFNIKWSHSGSLIALADPTGINIFEWNIDFASKSAMKIDIGVKKIFRASFNPDGSKLLICSESSIAIWDFFMESKEEIQMESDDYDSINDIRWNQNGNKIVFLSEEFVYLWDSDTKILKSHEFENENENSIRIARFGCSDNLIAMAGNKIIEIRDYLQNFKIVQTISAHSRNITDLRWNENGTKLLSTSRDKFIKIWETSAWKENLKILKHNNFVNCAIWNKNEEYIISAGADLYLRIFNSEDGNEVRSIFTNEENVRSLTLFRGEFIATLNPIDSSIKIWDMKTGVQLKSKKLNHGKIFTIDGNNQGNKIAVATSNGTIIYGHENIWEDFEEHKFLYFLFDYLPKCKELNLNSKSLITKIVNYYFLHKVSAFHILIENKQFDEFNELISFCLKNEIVCRRFYDSYQKPIFRLMNSTQEDDNNVETKNPFTPTPLISIDLFIDFVIKSNPELGCLFYVEHQSLIKYTINNSEKLCELLESRFKKVENNIFDAKWSDDRKQSSSLMIRCNEIRKSILLPENNGTNKQQMPKKAYFSGTEIYERKESSQRPIFKMMDIPIFLLSYDFIKVCCESKYFEEICKSRVIISLVDVLWVNHIRQKFITKNITYFLYFFLLIGNSVIVSPFYIRDKENKSEGNFWLPFLILSILLAIILVIMCKIEIDEWRQNRKYYFNSVWNYADHLNILFSFLSFLFNIVVLSGATQQFGLLRVLQSISFFFSMIRMFDFFRAFKSTCFLIEMILQVIADMKVFLFLMTILVTAFTLSSKKNFCKNLIFYLKFYC